MLFAASSACAAPPLTQRLETSRSLSVNGWSFRHTLLRLSRLSVSTTKRLKQKLSSARGMYTTNDDELSPSQLAVSDDAVNPSFGLLIPKRIDVWRVSSHGIFLGSSVARARAAAHVHVRLVAQLARFLQRLAVADLEGEDLDVEDAVRLEVVVPEVEGAALQPLALGAGGAVALSDKRVDEV